MRILYITTIGGTMPFFKAFIRQLLDEGNEVDLACNERGSMVPDYYREWGCKIHNLSCSRNPFNFGNIATIGEIRKIVSKYDYDLVHCHTPIAASCTRIACRSERKKGLKVIYTAHGFHFYKGAPKKNWLIYYPVEKFCSYFTDVLITINQEDYALAKKKMKAGRIEYVPGVGIDLEKFGRITTDKDVKRRELGIPEDAKWLLNIGELIPRKNQETLIRAVAGIKNVYLTIAGCGDLMKTLTELIDDLGVSDRIRLLGFRTDISELCNACDIFAFPSFHEGLPVSVMEAMASGLPVVCSKIRGNTDLIDENGGVLFDPCSAEDCRKAILELMDKDLLRTGEYNVGKIKLYEVNKVNDSLMRIYEK